MSTTPLTPRRKESRLAVRLTSEQDALIREAATATGQSISDFVTAAVIARAEDALVDRRVFRLDDSAWEEFSAILDRPSRPVPELSRLLAERAPWDGVDSIDPSRPR